MEEIKPIPNLHILLLLGIGWGNRNLQKKLSGYDRIILCGPVWMGTFIYPLKSFIQKHKSEIKNWSFVTCCGSSYKLKDDKYGHEMVFKKIKDQFPDINIQCTALPITMTLPDDSQDDTKAMMETRLSDDNFNGIFLEKFNEFVENIQNG